MNRYLSTSGESAPGAAMVVIPGQSSGRRSFPSRRHRARITASSQSPLEGPTRRSRAFGHSASGGVPSVDPVRAHERRRHLARLPLRGLGGRRCHLGRDRLRERRDRRRPEHHAGQLCHDRDDGSLRRRHRHHVEGHPRLPPVREPEPLRGDGPEHQRQCRRPSVSASDGLGRRAQASPASFSSRAPQAPPRASSSRYPTTRHCSSLRRTSC